MWVLSLNLTDQFNFNSIDSGCPKNPKPTPKSMIFFLCQNIMNISEWIWYACVQGFSYEMESKIHVHRKWQFQITGDLICPVSV